MKRTVCLLLTLCLTLLALAGCQDTPGSVPSEDGSSTVSVAPSTVSEPAVSTASPAEQPEDPSLTAAGCPPLPRDLQVLYREAEDLYRCFTLCGFDCDSTASFQIGGMTYHRIKDGRFKTYAELRACLEQYFTQELIDRRLLTADGCVQPNEQGEACMLDAGGGEDVTYAGHVFTVDDRTDDTIALTATAYYAADLYTGALFYTTPADPSAYTAKTYRFTLVDQGDGFRFSEFAFMR